VRHCACAARKCSGRILQTCASIAANLLRGAAQVHSHAAQRRMHSPAGARPNPHLPADHVIISLRCIMAGCSILPPGDMRMGYVWCARTLCAMQGSLTFRGSPMT
jgi:hypothetical protein